MALLKKKILKKKHISLQALWAKISHSIPILEIFYVHMDTWYIASTYFWIWLTEMYNMYAGGGRLVYGVFHMVYVNYLFIYFCS